MTRLHLTLVLSLLATLVAGRIHAEEDLEGTIYLELLPAAGDSETPSPDGPPPEEEKPGLRVAVGRPTASAPIAGWCELLRRQEASSLLPEVLLRDSEYDRFATDSVPLLVEILIDDVEYRYALGTERPRGATGLEFPFFELCPLGFGRREGPEWAIDVVHLANHRRDHMALGIYKGVLPATERTYLENQLGHTATLPDPAGALLLGQDQKIEALLLAESVDGAAFDKLRSAIVR